MTTHDLLARLTTEEKVGLLSGDGPWGVGGVPRIGLPGIVLTDGPHGVRLMSDPSQAIALDDAVPATCFPTAAALGSTWDVGLLAEVGAALGRDARELGVDVLLGPGLNLKRHPRGGRNFEYLSEDPVVGGMLAAAMVRGIQSRGRHGDPWTVMCGYNRLGGVYTSQHRWLLTDVLRDAWGFDGLVMSDWGAVDDRLEGVRAGLDLEMPGGGGAHDARLTAALASGALAEADLDTCVARVIQLIRRVRPHGAPTPAPRPALAAATVEAHHELARRAAAAGTVLLKNDRGLLPLDQGATVALIGPFADAPRFQGAGSSKVRPTRLETLLTALSDLVEDVRHDDGSDVDRAAAVASAADVAVVAIGLPEEEESEGFDRPDLRLPAHHDALISAALAANRRTIVVLCAGAPLELPWAPDVPAILTGYLGGQASGAATADVLTGRAEPGGRLAETWPLHEADVPATSNFPGHPRQVQHREGLMVGYRAAVTLGRLPAFPFGHGLSYTTIELSAPTLASAEVDIDRLAAGHEVPVRVTASNTGDRRGSQVVQLYVRRPRSAVPRPDRELKAFAKVHLDPGERTEVTLRLGEQAFRHHDPVAGWSIEPGPAEILIGTSSADLPHQLVLQVGAGRGDRPTPTPPAVMDDGTFAAALGHPIPAPRGGDRFDRNSTVADLQRTALGRRVRTQLLRVVVGRLPADASPVTRKAVERGADELPLRGLVLFSDGSLTFRHLAVLLDVLNGRWSSAGRRALSSLRVGGS